MSCKLLFGGFKEITYVCLWLLVVFHLFKKLAFSCIFLKTTTIELRKKTKGSKEPVSLTGPYVWHKLIILRIKISNVWGSMLMVSFVKGLLYSDMPGLVLICIISSFRADVENMISHRVQCLHKCQHFRHICRLVGTKWRMTRLVQVIIPIKYAFVVSEGKKWEN